MLVDHCPHILDGPPLHHVGLNLLLVWWIIVAISSMDLLLIEWALDLLLIGWIIVPISIMDFLLIKWVLDVLLIWWIFVAVSLIF